MKRTLFSIATFVVLTLASVMPAAAKDAVKAAVVPNTPPSPIVAVNGNAYSSGTYAVGTIQLFYQVSAFSFTPGNFASFTLNLQDVTIQGNGQSPDYGVACGSGSGINLSLSQTGSQNLVLTPATSSFCMTGLGWAGSTTVQISIPSGVPSTNGTDLVANLQLSTPGGSHVDTVTTIQVHITLVHPASCLAVYHFITDEQMTTAVESTTVHVNAQQNKITGTLPFAQLSNNVMIVNTCGTTQTLDLKMTLDSWFETNPNNNPGNAVFTFSTAGSETPATFNFSSFGTGTARGQQMCLGNMSIASGTTFLATVHMQIKKQSASTLANEGSFNFDAALYAAGSGCTGSLLTLPNPNPAPATLLYAKQ